MVAVRFGPAKYLKTQRGIKVQEHDSATDHN
jgi:hypothetical protein